MSRVEPPSTAESQDQTHLHGQCADEPIHTLTERLIDSPVDNQKTKLGIIFTTNIKKSRYRLLHVRTVKNGRVPSNS